MPIIVTGRKPICCKGGETSPLFSTFPENKAFGVRVKQSSDPNSFLVESVISLSPVMDMPASGTDAVKSPVGPTLQTSFTEKSFPDACPVAEKENWEWQVVVKTN